MTRIAAKILNPRRKTTKQPEAPPRDPLIPAQATPAEADILQRLLTLARLEQDGAWSSDLDKMADVKTRKVASSYGRSYIRAFNEIRGRIIDPPAPGPYMRDQYGRLR